MVVVGTVVRIRREHANGKPTKAIAGGINGTALRSELADRLIGRRTACRRVAVRMTMPIMFIRREPQRGSGRE